MSKIFTFLLLALLSGAVIAQAPDKMSYQAVIRDAANNLVSSSMVGMQISILQGSIAGSAVYLETHSTTSNQNGLVTIEIGTGVAISGDLSTIDWSNGPYFIKTETDPNGGTNYTITGTSELLSVPYAFMANSALNPTFAPSESDESIASIAYTQRNSWERDTNILVTVPESGLYLVSYHGSLSTSSTYNSTTDYDGEGMIRVYNATSGIGLNQTRALSMQIDVTDAVGNFFRRYVPLYPSNSLLVNLNANDELELHYLLYGIGTPLTSNFYSFDGGITIVKVGN